MCLILFAYESHPKHRLIVAANRDEFFERPTAQAAFWEDAPHILAGRDLVHGGTWLGVSRSGKFAAITNYRDPRAPRGGVSRGMLVKEFLEDGLGASEFLSLTEKRRGEFSGFNLLLGEFGNGSSALHYFSNREGEPRKLESGIYGLSNHLLDTPWRKVVRSKEKVRNAISSEIFSTRSELAHQPFFEILENRELAGDDELPDTGVGIERERILSSAFIETPIYGTRSMTLLTITSEGVISFTEKTTQPRPVEVEKEFVSFEFRIEKKYTRQDSNLRPSDSKSDTLSS